MNEFHFVYYPIHLFIHSSAIIIVLYCDVRHYGVVLWVRLLGNVMKGRYGFLGNKGEHMAGAILWCVLGVHVLVPSEAAAFLFFYF